MITKYRTESPVQFIQTMRDLFSHTAFYLNRLPKAMKFVWHVPMVDICRWMLSELIEGNSCKNMAKRTEKFDAVLLKLDVFEESLSAIASNDEWFSAINGDDPQGCYPFVRWGELIDRERNLLRKVISKLGGSVV